MNNKENILEELNRIKFLLNYEKGKVISEQKIVLFEEPNTTTQTTTNPNTMGKYKTGQSITSKTTTEKINVTFSKKADYEVRSFDPKSFINDFITEIYTKIKEKNPDNKPLKLDSIIITAGASNIWNRKKTYYDVENDYNTKNINQKPASDPGYDGNIKLATNRAQTFWNTLKTLIAQRVDPPKIEIVDTIVPTFKTLVVNTNGVQDSVNMKNNPNANPGQFVSLNMNFSYVNVKTELITKNTFGYSPVITSTYWCDGSDGAGQWVGFTGGCATNGVLQTPKEVLGGKNEKEPNNGAKKKGASLDSPLHNFITMYQLKFNNQIARWDFKWGNGKITSILKRDVTNNIGVDPTTGKPQVVKGAGEIIGSPELMTELKNAMDFPKFENGKITDKSWRQSFEFYVQPYL